MTTFRINEIFYSLQGEGITTGRATVFVRFSGCNRACSFCDTDFDNYELLTSEQIITEIKKIIDEYLITNDDWQIILTGGEPSLQVNSELIKDIKTTFPLIPIRMETNGTLLNQIPSQVLTNISLSVSPKTENDAKLVCAFFTKESVQNRVFDEIKIVSVPYDNTKGLEYNLQIFDNINKNVNLYLQPCDYGNEFKNKEEIKKCVSAIKKNPRWKLSLQIHKIIGIQ